MRAAFMCVKFSKNNFFEILLLALLIFPTLNAQACVESFEFRYADGGGYTVAYRNSKLTFDGRESDWSLTNLKNNWSTEAAKASNGAEAMKWLECHMRAGNSKQIQNDKTNSTGGRPPSINSAGFDEVTPQVPGCPKYVSKLNIEWRRKPGANPQLNVWEVRNVSDKFTFRVTYRADGANTDLPTLNAGDVAEAWGLRAEPPFVVRNFYDMKNWERANSQQKSLECSLAIRPR